MYKMNVGFFGYKKIIKESNQNIYYDEESRMTIRLDENCLSQMKSGISIINGTSKINPKQIEMLCSKQPSIDKTRLPFGVLYFKSEPVGVLYPYILKSYHSFEELYKEDSSLILANYRQAFLNNLELLQNDIYNKDFSSKNTLYNGKRVEIFGLEGKMIGDKSNSSYSQVYQYYLIGLYNCIKEKLTMLYGNDSDKVMSEIEHLFIPYSDMSIDYPLHVIEEIESKRILK